MVSFFQLDNDPKHTARKIKSYLEWKKQSGDVQVMKWPPQSPHLTSVCMQAAILGNVRQETIKQLFHIQIFHNILIFLLNKIGAFFKNA